MRDTRWKTWLKSMRLSQSSRVAIDGASMNMPVCRVTCFANAADVCMTMVAGRVLMEDRRVLSVDGTRFASA
ncbi:hypothetical protein [Burkholderia territorii]|uniref:hypothetical protein n=1 Tax=Burkholderia territorii TaxID=1503055 RepID=UPI0007BA709C|nr:hypothetical protein [Burkholderia territorii]